MLHLILQSALHRHKWSGVKTVNFQYGNSSLKKACSTKDQFMISKYMNPAPYSKGMPHESPGQVAVWVGWKIVDEFMQNNSEISISELFEIKDAQYILNQSKYKP